VLVFLQKTFCNRIDADEQLDDPEQAVPYPALRFFHGHVQNKGRGNHIQQHTIESILLPYLQEQVFFKQGPYGV
jgi:hypothetical protein